jgi:hypothetical protein
MPELELLVIVAPVNERVCDRTVCFAFFKVLADFGTLEIQKIETFLFTTSHNVRAGLVWGKSWVCQDQCVG